MIGNKDKATTMTSDSRLALKAAVLVFKRYLKEVHGAATDTRRDPGSSETLLTHLRDTGFSHTHTKTTTTV